MGRFGDIASPAELTHVGGDSAPGPVDLDGGGGHPQVEALADELVGDGVELLVRSLDVVVDADGDLLPLGELIGVLGKGPKRRALELAEQVLPRGHLAAKGPGVQLVHLGRDRLVQLGEREEPSVAKRRQHPPLDREHTCLGGRLVTRPAHPRRQHDRVVVGGELAIGGVELGLVEAGRRDAGLQVVRHGDLADAAEGREGVHVGADEAREVLAPRRLDVAHPREAEHGDEHLGLVHLARLGIAPGRLVAGEVDEHPLAGRVGEAHDDVQGGDEAAVVLAELAVAEALGVLGAPLEPEKAQRHVVATSAQLLVDGGPVRDRTLGRRLELREEQGLEALLVQLVGQWPGHPGGVRPAEVLADGAPRHADGPGDLARGPPRGAKSENFGGLAHG